MIRALIAALLTVTPAWAADDKPLPPSLFTLNSVTLYPSDQMTGFSGALLDLPEIPKGGPVTDDFKRGACWAARVVSLDRVATDIQITIFDGVDPIVCEPMK